MRSRKEIYLVLLLIVVCTAAFAEEVITLQEAKKLHWNKADLCN